jgi:hypothetical protein
MKTVLKFPGSSKIWHGSGAFPAEIPTTAKPNHHLSPSFPRNPLSPPSDPVQRRLQSPPAKSNFLAVTFTISVFASVFGVSDPDEHTLKSKTVASCKVMRNDVVVLSTEDETVTSTFNSYEK